MFSPIAADALARLESSQLRVHPMVPPRPANVPKAAASTSAKTRAVADSSILTLPGFGPGEDEGARPFLKWAGGKTRLLQVLLPYFPSKFRDYYEPFLGGGSVFFAVRGRTRGRPLLFDLNTELVNVWLAVKNEPRALLRALEAYSGLDTEEDYYSVRDGEWPTARIERAALFVYLNQTAWNGLWRVNKWGVFNVPWGARPFRGIAKPALMRVNAALSDAEIAEADFREVLERPRKGDFVYLDPPYLPISDTSKFAGYTEKRFRKADLAELARCCERLTERGVSWVMSNRDNAMVRELFGHAKRVALTTRRSVAAQNKRDIQPADSPEVVVIGGPLV